VTDLNALIRSQPALYEQDFHYEGFEWIDCHSRDDSVLAYMRKARNWEDHLIVIVNFTPVFREKHRVGVPQQRYYREVFNSDSQYYGGSNQGNFPGVMAQQPGHHGRPWSLTINLPPLAGVVFKPD
jgi:1,4-alpha-glucan branching enzyme